MTQADHKPGRYLQATLRALLIAWLLLAQASAFAHELDHDLSGEPELCATCSIGSLTQLASCSTTETVVPEGLRAALAPTQTAIHIASGFRPANARAPPTTS